MRGKWHPEESGKSKKAWRKNSPIVEGFSLVGPRLAMQKMCQVVASTKLARVGWRRWAPPLLCIAIDKFLANRLIGLDLARDLVDARAEGARRHRRAALPFPHDA